jgi:hypothetical protein
MRTEQSKVAFIQKMKDKVSKNSLLEAHVLSLEEAKKDPDSMLGLKSPNISSRSPHPSSRAGSMLTIRQSDLP